MLQEWFLRKSRFIIDLMFLFFFSFFIADVIRCFLNSEELWRLSSVAEFSNAIYVYFKRSCNFVLENEIKGLIHSHCHLRNKSVMICFPNHIGTLDYPYVKLKTHYFRMVRICKTHVKLEVNNLFYNLTLTNYIICSWIQ